MSAGIRLVRDDCVLEGVLRHEAIALAWEAPSRGAREVDGTWQITATVDVSPDVWLRAVGFAHTRLRVDDAGAVRPLAARWAEDLVATAFFDGSTAQPGGRVVGVDHWYPHGDDGLPPTRAPRWAGAARDALDGALDLESRPGMQDWPLEVSDPAKIHAAMARYERADDALRFDLMQFVLFSAEEVDPSDAAVFSWIESTLRRDFARHGHTVAYWALLADLGADGRRNADAGWPVLTPLARRVFDACVVPLRAATAD